MALNYERADVGKFPTSSGNSHVFVFDRRKTCSPEKVVEINDVTRHSLFESKIRKVFSIPRNVPFVIVTTDRKVIWDDDTYSRLVYNEVTLYLLEDVDQPLLAPTRERIDYLPHYDTLVKSGMYEYYASEGKNPLPFAFAELIDNALTATNENDGPRNIEVRMYFNDSPEKCMVCVLDNGRGMSSAELNNWAIYRLSKFSHRRRGDADMEEEPTRSQIRQSEDYPRFLNSDISYFGVGGKAAIFFIGQSARMISKSSASKDVHELSISKEEFERRERDKEAIYKGYIYNRQAGDTSHVTQNDENMVKLLQEELGQESFTHVMITGIKTEHIQYLREDFNRWCTQLVHIYHYYLHGPDGNNPQAATNARPASPFNHISIVISHYNKGKLVQKRNLRDVDDDMQSKFILSSGRSFDFRARVEGDAVVEGTMRYHPFLYNRETFPVDNSNWYSAQGDGSDDEADFIPRDRPARGNRPIFECYWNGRLIPYTTVDELEWCVPPKRTGNIPIECFNRLSGVLWTNDKFEVSTNKLTFLDLGVRLKEKSTYFERIIGGQSQRVNIQRKFHEWLKTCHESFDKQVMFKGFKGCFTRTDVPNKKHQYPWCIFKSILWEGKEFSAGQLVRTTRTNPIMYGKIKHFLLHGFYDGDVFSTGGEFVLIQEPHMLYNEEKTFLLSKLDRLVNFNVLRRGMDVEEGKLPHSLLVQWPEGNEIKVGSKIPAGGVIGDIQVQLVNRRGEEMTKLPNSTTPSKRFLIEQIVIKHDSSGDSRIVCHISQYNKQWSHWFHKIDSIREVGTYSLVLQAVIGESGATEFGDKSLPNVRIKFRVVEGPPAKFSIGLMEAPCRIGVPFSIPLQLRDRFNHLCSPDTSLIPQVKANGLDLSWEGTEARNDLLYIRNVMATGKVLSSQDFSLKVTITGFQDATQKLRVRMLPGAIHSIRVAQFLMGNAIVVENGQPLSLDVELLDKAGNPTMQKGAKLTCKFLGRPGLPPYRAQCSESGATQLTGKPLQIKNMTMTSIKLTAKVEVEGISRKVEPAEHQLEVTPGTTPHYLNVKYKKDGKDITLVDGEEIECVVGESISNLVYAIWDEGRRQLLYTPSLVSKISVNWQSKPDRELLSIGRLPDVKAPTKVDESKFCKIDINEGKGLSFSFSIKPLVGSPHQLKCMCQGSKKVRLDEFYDGKVEVLVTDNYGNSLKRLPQRALSKLRVTAAGLDQRVLETKYLPSIGFGLSKIRFRGTATGNKEIVVEYEEFKDSFKLTVDPGQAGHLQFLHYAPNDVIHLNKGDLLPRSLQLQICDSNGNPCQEPGAVATLHTPVGLEDVVVNWCKLVATFVPVQAAGMTVDVDGFPDPSAKPVGVLVKNFDISPVDGVLKNASSTVKSQKSGKIDFGRPEVQGEWSRYEVSITAVIGKKKLTGPKLIILIEADNKRPSTLDVMYKKKWTYVVGQLMPDFEVKVLSEAGTVVPDLPAQCLFMKQWKPTSSQQSKPPPSAFSWVVDTESRPEDDPNCFYFRNRMAPEKAGFHHIVFEGNFKGVRIHSDLIVANIQPGAPDSLAADHSLSTLSVSNTPQPHTRCLISSLKLHLKDKFGNITGQNISGQVKVRLYGKDTTAVIPMLNGKKSFLFFPLKNGTVQLVNIHLQEGTPGNDGHEYVVKVELDESTARGVTENVKPYLQPFMFYNDAKKQERMVALTRERDECQLIISKFTQIFADSQEVHNTLKGELKKVEQKEGVMKTKLKALGVPHTAMLSLDSVNETLKLCDQAKQSIHSAPRRTCQLARYASSDPDVLGKVAHLAEVEDDTIAWVLSWHLMGEMDCVITKTTAKAKEVHATCKGSQQVLPIDSIFTKNLPNWNSQLPHERVNHLRHNWTPTGNPIHARHLLKFTKEQKDCQLLFRMILGDTIIFDSLDDATDYRKRVVQHTSCPTLLTREGDRMRSSGKFGGFQNRAPPLERLRGTIFGAPVPAKYEQTIKQIEHLTQLVEVLKEKEGAAQELQDHINEMNSSKVQGQRREMEETRQRLGQVEAKLKSAKGEISRSVPIPMETLEPPRPATTRRSPRAPTRDPRLLKDRAATRRSAASQSKESPSPKRRR